MSEVLDPQEEQQPEKYSPSEEERKFILRAYSDYQECANIKNEGQDVLGGRTLQTFWDESNYDYNVLVDEMDIDDPVTPYSSGVSRDKSNTFITNLTLSMLYPSVSAQNKEQKIDHVVSKVSRSILEWQYDNDGRPAESGHVKAVRNTHKQVIEGTVHVQDDIDPDTGGLISQIVPNEEIFIPNFWQPNIQEQPYIFRVQDNVLYDEAKSQFGSLENFDFVEKGPKENWAIGDTPEFKDKFTGIIDDGRVQIVYLWYDIRKEDFKQYNVPKGVKKAKLFNIMINGVLMFKVDNLSPYRDGCFPINKGIFEMFSKSEYYWGNSMPNKARQDKKWLDGWKTLIRHKGKLGAIPPLLTFNGQLVDSDVFIPGTATPAPAGMTKDDIMATPGTDQGVTQSEFALLQEAKNEIDEGNLSPQASGQEGKSQTAREAVIREQNEQKILGGFGLQVAFLVEARTYPVLMRSFQFLPRKKIKKLVVPNQQLKGGANGNLEVIFEKPEIESQEDLETQSLALATEEIKAERKGEAFNRVFVNPAYLKELDVYVKVVADPQPKKTSALRRAEAREKFELYASRPDLFNVRSAARAIVRANEDDETDMIASEPQPSQLPQQAPQSQGQKTLNKSINQSTANLGELT